MSARILPCPRSATGSSRSSSTACRPSSPRSPTSSSATTAPSCSACRGTGTRRARPDRRRCASATSRSPRRAGSRRCGGPTPSWSRAGADAERARRRRARSTRCGAPTLVAPAWCRSAPARSRWPRPGCSTVDPPPRTGRTPTSSARGTRRCALDPSVLYVDDGDVLTSAGSAASIDLAMHIVQRDHGADIANRVARDLVVPPHRRGGQAQFIQTPVGPPEECGDGLGAALEWASAHLDEELSVAALAEVALDEPAALRPAVPRRHRHDAAPVDPHPAARAGPPAARDHRARASSRSRRRAASAAPRRSGCTSSGRWARARPPTGARSARVARLTRALRRAARRGRAPACAGPSRRAARGPTRGRRTAWSR